MCINVHGEPSSQALWMDMQGGGGGGGGVYETIKNNRLTEKWVTITILIFHYTAIHYWNIVITV